MASATPRKFPSANWSVPLTLSAMDLAMSSGLVTCLVAEFCGVPDFPTAERAMPHMTRRAATRKTLILASGIRRKHTRTRATEGRDSTDRQGGEAAIAASRTRLWLVLGWGCRGRRLSRG